ncbi:hypothetical protein FT663_04796 [Candidozyma haemuli var. vulneris]|uniref:tRNA wybutosine-synthesizing protein 2 n=1 Tax=Candidozyma haemuli TaxID=45357 RepID=A0A2V1AYF3_9ASCO|nr:hypothetical protein CXQ85_002586 [[Candida] haemuloni]KAF3986444.1 hypothetical protein FT662_04555 [[Candida] haemuloni var. vulneris]KAF3986634.1 hypothetical protein FT663_04796 [[Candida] haemuloni var. vulneris]PVH22862.1 hypothetical protein CXQ85_002586 [[Candida] haemuloni]
MGTKILVREPRLIKEIKTVLEDGGVFDKSRRIQSHDGVSCLFSTGSLSEMRVLLKEYDTNKIDVVEDESEAVTRLVGLQGIVADVIGYDKSDLLETVPKKWSLYPPMVLFQGGSFSTPRWKQYFEENGRDKLFKHLSEKFFTGYTHYAVNQPIIETDVMRRPFNLVPLYGDFGPDPNEARFEDPMPADFKEAFWCTVTQNGICQEWAPRYTMFSRGNITEKKRLLDSYTKLDGHNVVDLYGGIGYFTLSYLTNGATVFCWELNPWSIEGLLRGLRKNGCKHTLIRVGEPFDVNIYQENVANGVKAFVFHESNEHSVERLFGLGLRISHYNLGLLPSSKQGWEVVKKLEEGTDSGCENAEEKRIARLIHVHENVHKNDFSQLSQELETFFGGTAVHLEKVKTFAPDVWHVVVDIKLKEMEV